MDGPLFGDELRRLRQAAGISLKPFAKLVHYDASYISKLENGVKRPSYEVAKACDEALNIGDTLRQLAVAHPMRPARLTLA